MATEELLKVLLLQGRQLYGCAQHLPPLDAAPPLLHVLLCHDHCKDTEIASVCNVSPRKHRLKTLQTVQIDLSHICLIADIVLITCDAGSSCRTDSEPEIKALPQDNEKPAVVSGCYLLSGRMPMSWHLRKRHAWHDRRLFLVILHLFRNGQRSCVVLFMARLNLFKHPL